MDTKEIYRPPTVEIKREIALPGLVKAAYGLIAVFVAIGIGTAFLIIDDSSDDLMFELSFTLFFIAITLLLGWWLYRPIRDQQANAYQLPLLMLVIFGGITCYDIYQNEFKYDVSGMMDIVEYMIFLLLALILKTKRYRAWCESSSNK